MCLPKRVTGNNLVLHKALNHTHEYVYLNNKQNQFCVVMWCHLFIHSGMHANMFKQLFLNKMIQLSWPLDEVGLCSHLERMNCRQCIILSS